MTELRSRSVAPMYRDDPRLEPLIGPGARFEVEDVVVDGVELRDFVRAPGSIVACFEMGEAHAELDHLVYRDERWTFAAVHDRARRVARALRDDFGVARGDRVVIAMRNLPEFVVSFWAAALTGAIVVPLNAWWSGAELGYALGDAGAKVAFVDEERLERLVGAEGLAPVAFVGVRCDGGAARFDDLVVAAALADDDIVRLAPDDPVTILYTSGTTGRPRGALGTNRGAMANLWNIAFGSARSAIIAARPEPPPSRPTSLSAAPLFHIGGISAIISGQVSGSKLVLMHRWDLDEAVRLIEAEGVNNLGGVPAIARQLLEHPRITELGLDVRTVPLGGAPVAPDLPLLARDRFGDGVQVFNGYGLTETTSAVVTNVGAEFLARPESVGRPNLTADVKVVDPDDRVLPPGAVGEICMRSPQVVPGYWNDEAGTRQVFVDGWFHSGDLGYLDDEGYLYVVDRLKDVVIRGGENVYCAEVEAVLHEHPSVAEVAIVGIEDRVLGEVVCAVVVPRPGVDVDLDTIHGFAADRLARFKCPEALLLVSELPRNATGKVAKIELRDAVRASDAVERR